MAYGDHARMLKRESEQVYGGIRDSLRFLGDNETASVDRLVQELLKVGNRACFLREGEILMPFAFF